MLTGQEAKGLDRERMEMEINMMDGWYDVVTETNTQGDGLF